MAENTADKLAGKMSLADRLRQRRIALEGGDPQKASKAFKTKSKQKKSVPSY